MAFSGHEVFNALEQFRVAVCAHFGVAEFAGVGAFNLAAQLGGHGLHAVADAQHGNAQLEHCVRRAVIDFVDGSVAAREDDAFELAVSGKLAHPFAAHIAGVDFAVHVGFAHATCDQLCDLRTEVKNQDLVMLHGVIQGQEKEKSMSKIARCQKCNSALSGRSNLGRIKGRQRHTQ